MDAKVRIAIVEDIDADRELLIRNLRRYEREKGVVFELRQFQDGEDLVTNYTADYDLILMDIRMTFMDGMTAARRVREKDGEVAIVFITNTPQYAIEGYKVGATDYILKPIAWFSFQESLGRALGRRDEGGYITIAMRDGRTKLEVDRICYVEVQDHQLIYNTLDGRYEAKGTMRDAEAQLKGRHFFKCNRCYLVHLKHIDTCRGNDIFVNGDTIQVSRRQRKGFLDALNDYLNGENA